MTILQLLGVVGLSVIACNRAVLEGQERASETARRMADGAPDDETPVVLKARDFDAHVEGLKMRVPDEGFSWVVEPPFVVIGDEEPAKVEERAIRTVRWAVEKLKKEYFDVDPEHIIDIWLFKDEASYRKHAEKIFGDRPDTPFGYYSRRHRAMIMNIATGGGTLVHEIVHPFMEANFLACPAWFNEGLASLYEQSSEQDGRIRGLTNWRLAGLKKAIREGRAGKLAELMSTTDAQFYDDQEGTHYARARYLCYYLQEKDLLKSFFRKFKDDHLEDPSGLASLKEVLGTDDLDGFQREWEAFVLELRFP